MDDLTPGNCADGSSDLLDSAAAFCAQRRLDELTVALNEEPFSEARRGDLAAFLDGGFRTGQQAWYRLRKPGASR